MGRGAFGVMQELGNTSTDIAASTSTLHLHFKYKTMTPGLG